MSWKRHFRVVKSTYSTSPLPAPPLDRAGTSTSSNFSSYLPLVYAGHPNRIQRYYQFDDMDKDSDINAALDTIADFSTLSEEHMDEPFEFKWNGEPNESEVKILKTMLSKWTRINNFRARLWYMFRDTLKNGDAFFLRDPETQEWLWLDHFMVEMVKVDDTKGKKPDEYLIRGLDYNSQTKFGSKQADPNQYRTPYGTSNIGASRVSSVSTSSAPAAFSLAGSSSDPRQRHMLGPFSQDVYVVDAENIVHLSLSIGNDINWPFGTSILEPIFKVFKQKELLEDAIIIYRVQRAPERRIFYIDTGTMPPERAKRHLEMIKNDIHQRRIPNRTGTGGNILDAAYNPLSINDDYFFAQCLQLGTRINLLDGRILSLEEIINEYEQGKENIVHSLNLETHELESGRIIWAGVTRRDAEMVRVTLDNGEYIDATPDHRFILRDGTECQAGNLRPDDSLMPLYYTCTYKVVSVEMLSYREDTGDITIETKSGSHIFALAAGIYVHNSSDGRGSKVETLPGGEQTGEITDLMFFSRKMARGLRVPTSYLNLGEDDSSSNVTFNDGKLGAAMIQEFRFTKYCMRWQSLLAPIFDKEFKRYMVKSGIEMDWSLFDLQFRPPQSFTKYRQIELDAQRVQVYQGVSENRRLAERFKLTRFLGLTEDELIDNEKLWSEENAAKIKQKSGVNTESSPTDNLSAVGVRPMGGDEMMPDIQGEEPAGGEATGGGAPAPSNAGGTIPGAGTPGGETSGGIGTA